jgi:acetyl esterase
MGLKAMAAHWQEFSNGRSAATPLSVRFYESENRLEAGPLVLYFGGGAFQQAPLPVAERPVARALAERGAMVVEADYAGALDNAFPEALEQAFAVLGCICTRRKQFGGGKSQLFVAGEEAGGNIAAGVALKARDQLPGQLAGQLLMSPMIDPQMASGSMRTAGDIGMLRRWTDGWSRYLQSACSFIHPYAAPCLCSRLSGVAPALVMTAEDDPLHDEVEDYAKRLILADVEVRTHVFPPGSGWTNIYKGEGGAWVTSVCDEFASFAAQLKH